MLYPRAPAGNWPAAEEYEHRVPPTSSTALVPIGKGKGKGRFTVVRQWDAPPLQPFRPHTWYQPSGNTTMGKLFKGKADWQGKGKGLGPTGRYSYSFEAPQRQATLQQQWEFEQVF